MANWDKLNKQFDDLIDKMSHEDWVLWAENKESRKEMRRMEILLKQKLQEEKIYLSSREGITIFSEISVSTGFSVERLLCDVADKSLAGENNYSLAA